MGKIDGGNGVEKGGEGKDLSDRVKGIDNIGQGLAKWRIEVIVEKKSLDARAGMVLVLTYSWS